MKEYKDEAREIGDALERILVRALHEIQQRPHYRFVALKTFRDRLLPAALESAIAKGWIEVYHVQNPEKPEWPTAAIRVSETGRAYVGGDHG